jgi:uncharacterized protein
MTESQESLVSNKPPLTSLILIFAVIFIGFAIVGPLVGLAIGGAMYEGNLMQDMVDNTPGEHAFVPLMVMQACASFIGLILLPALYVRYTEQKPLAPFFKREHNLPLTVLLICLLGVSFIVALSPITAWNMNVEFPEALKAFGDWARAQEDKLAEMTKFLTTFNSVGEFLIALVVIAIIPGIGEEFVFRGLIQNELYRSSKNIHISIWVAAILFSAIHMQFFGFLPRMFLGALFGYLYYWSGNLWIPIIGHIFNNGFALTMLYLHSLGVSDLNVEDETAAPFSAVAFCAIATFALLYYFRKQYVTPQQPS